MTRPSTAIKKLRRIRKLWQSVKGTRVNTPRYNKIIDKISVLSKQYQKLVKAALEAERIRRKQRRSEKARKSD
jgi:hypothetical protein